MKVFVSLGIPEKGIRMLQEAGLEVTVYRGDQPLSQEQLTETCQQHDALLSMGTYKIDRPFLQACPHLKIISQFSVGYDNIDLAEATRLGIPVANAPGAMTEATADVAFGLMLAVSRKMFFMHKTIEAGKWKHFRPQAHLGQELKGKTLGIFGMGRIGQAFTQRCQGAYNMKVIYHNRHRNEEAEAKFNATWESFEELLQESDVLSVHSALTSATRGKFNLTVFEQMKDTAIFINTARGGIHNEPDLIRALQEGAIWGAGLDVTSPEPMPPDNPLLQMENVCVLPHIGSATIEARTAMSQLAAANIIAFSQGETIPHQINLEVNPSV